MSDVDIIRDMLDRADVRYAQTTPRAEVYERGVKNDFMREGTVTEITTAGDMDGPEPGKGNLGYIGFYTAFGFDKDGNLISVGAWE